MHHIQSEVSWLSSAVIFTALKNNSERFLWRLTYFFFIRVLIVDRRVNKGHKVTYHSLKVNDFRHFKARKLWKSFHSSVSSATSSCLRQLGRRPRSFWSASTCSCLVISIFLRISHNSCYGRIRHSVKPAQNETKQQRKPRPILLVFHMGTTGLGAFIPTSTAWMLGQAQIHFR